MIHAMAMPVDLKLVCESGVLPHWALVAARSHHPVVYRLSWIYVKMMPLCLALGDWNHPHFCHYGTVLKMHHPESLDGRQFVEKACVAQHHRLMLPVAQHAPRLSQYVDLRTLPHWKTPYQPVCWSQKQLVCLRAGLPSPCWAAESSLFAFQPQWWERQSSHCLGSGYLQCLLQKPIAGPGLEESALGGRAFSSFCWLARSTLL